MESGFVETLLPELERLATAFKKALRDNAMESCDLVNEGVIKLLEVGSSTDDPDAKRRKAIRIFINSCRDLERRAVRRYVAHYTDVPDEVIESVPGPYSFASLLTRMAIEECLGTLAELDRSLIMEFVQPTDGVARIAVSRVRAAKGHGSTSGITLRDIAAGRGVPFSSVQRAVHRARYALVAGGLN